MAIVELTLPTVGPTRTMVGGASQVALKLPLVQVLAQVREWNVSPDAQPAPESSSLPGTHELGGSPLQAWVVKAQYCEHVRVRVPQLPQSSFTTVPGRHPPAISLVH